MPLTPTVHIMVLIWDLVMLFKSEVKIVSGVHFMSGHFVLRTGFVLIYHMQRIEVSEITAQIRDLGKIKGKNLLINLVLLFQRHLKAQQ